MHILITGGTGLIGRTLISKLGDHEITVLTRSPQKAKNVLPSTVTTIADLDELTDFNNIDAVINLAGEPIVDKRWSDQQKGIICSSRWGITEKIVSRILTADNPPKTLISGSAVGYYSDQKDAIVDESLVVDATDFAHAVCANWERIALRARPAKTRVCLLRTGIVLSKEGGALKKMLLPYQLGLGGAIGDGNQYFPWIHIEDMANAIVHLLEKSEHEGAFNLTAPNPVTNREFSQSLAASLDRPHILFTPAFAIKLMLGEAGQLLLEGQRAIPKALEEDGFTFTYKEIRPALDSLLRQ
ncbi:TIGR01777 family oxidoreductase [Enterovibrio norvegicus]|uniref:TIGR01777 family oxidoreductase n=1 Tax=Enterovibrio norvegicus TaxID=188144 RepID=UPI0010BED033|nr:TIGR01777 family oxidoreductase [Enterovibrio norvegicus]TKF33549.1 TIGR01777 family protein [Enterovibrio norvegicus]